jgi:hypothetical protein
MVNGFYTVQDSFIRPTGQFGEHPLDIAIRCISREMVDAIGKVPLVLDEKRQPPYGLEFAYAVGFPEPQKHQVTEADGSYFISMPQFEVLAELNETPTRRFTMLSNLEAISKIGEVS